MFASLEDFGLGPEGGVDLVWSTKTIHDAETLKMVLQKYDSLILGRTWAVVDKESSGMIDDQQILEVSRHMVKQIQARLGQGFKLVEIPGENTLELSIALSNVETLQPILAVTNQLLPAYRGTSSVSRIITTDAAANAASVTVELLVSDATTSEPLIAAIDKRFGKNDIVMTIASRDNVKAATSLWTDRLWTTLSYWNWIKDHNPVPRR
ncbi:MAG: DUF3313 family protein [Desulfuromonadales bacterium]|nr:DUF3313 family protein [Desulfuromonadales bacterium]